MGRREGIMLCQPFEEKRLLKWNVPAVFCQPKLDGERCRAIIEEGNVRLISSEGNEIQSVPHIVDQLTKVPGTVELDGELYVHESEFSDIHSIVGRTVSLHNNFEKMEYHVFDIVSDYNQLDRIKLLEAMEKMVKLKSVKFIKSKLVFPSAEDIFAKMQEYTEEGYEGIIVRHPFNVYERKRSLYVMKFKPRKSDIYKVVGYQEEVSIHGDRKGSLGSFICAGNDGTCFGVGSGFTASQRLEYWQRRESLVGCYVEVRYQALTPKHVPRFPIFANLIESVEDATA